MTWLVSKRVSEVGCIVILKRKLGIKLKDPDALEREQGLPHTGEQVTRVLAIVEMGNRRREKFGRDAPEE